MSAEAMPHAAVLRILNGAPLDVINTGPPELREAAGAERTAIAKRLEAAHAPQINTSAEDSAL